ncbi:MAG: hypothetical protein FWB74_00160 [Defluviitaleaceae bacterium]|nr:hypothetical protein [Defluviitaleaceae bacterium]
MKKSPESEGKPLEDVPFPENSPLGKSSYMSEAGMLKYKEMDDKAKESAQKNEIEKEKLKIGKWTLIGCGIFLALFYISEIVIHSLGIKIEIQIRMMIIEPVRFVLAAIIGYLFAIKTPSGK